MCNDFVGLNTELFNLMKSGILRIIQKNIFF